MLARVELVALDARDALLEAEIGQVVDVCTGETRRVSASLLWACAIGHVGGKREVDGIDVRAEGGRGWVASG